MRKKFFIIALLLIIIIPILAFNAKKDQISEIDNRNLTELFPEEDKANKKPFSFPVMSMQFEDYLSDRIGFREQMLGIYGNGYKNIFGILKHPSYEYGKDGEAFYKFHDEKLNKKFVDDFNNFMGSVDRYLESRNIDFVFAANPAKNHLYPEEIPEYVHTSYQNMDYLRTLLPNNFFTSVDNIDYLQNVEATDRIFNKSFDVGHWTEYGAIIGISNMIEPLRRKYPTIGEISFTQYNKQQATAEYLPNSKIRIDEEITKFHPKDPQHISPEEYQQKLQSELKLHPTHRTFRIDQNPNNPDAPVLMIFRGSFMNHKEDFYADAFSEVIGIHNYENIYDLDYYLNLFKPDIVIFEVAASAFSEDYFNPRSLRSVKFNPAYERMANLPEQAPSQELIDQIKLSIQKKDILTDVVMTYPEEYDYVYFETVGRINDSHPTSNGDGTATTYTSVYNDRFSKVKVIMVNEKTKTKTTIDLEKLL